MTRSRAPNDSHIERSARTRSEIYSAAVREYVARHSGDAVTEAVNAVMEQVGGAGADPFVSRAALHTLERMVVSKGEIWWANLPSPTGSSPGFRRPVVSGTNFRVSL